jgi:hypothetical protein
MADVDTPHARVQPRSSVWLSEIRNCQPRLHKGCRRAQARENIRESCFGSAFRKKKTLLRELLSNGSTRIGQLGPWKSQEKRDLTSL